MAWVSRPSSTPQLSFPERLQLRASRHTPYDGLIISVLDVEDDTDAVLARVKAALALLDSYDPRSYRRLKADCQRIWVTALFGNIGEYHHKLRAILLDRRFVAFADTSASEIAATLLHEATHARLRACGIGYPPAKRARIERFCFERELAFASLLPDSEAIIRKVRRLQALPSSSWDDEALDSHAARGALRTFEYLGIPGWLARLVVWFATFVRRLLRRRAA